MEGDGSAACYYSPFHHRLVFDACSGGVNAMATGARLTHVHGEGVCAVVGSRSPSAPAHRPQLPLLDDLLADSAAAVDENRPPASLERTLKVRVAAADPTEADTIDRVLREWQALHAATVAACQVLHRQNRPAEAIRTCILSSPPGDDPAAAALPSVSCGRIGVREGAFLEWRRQLDADYGGGATCLPAPCPTFGDGKRRTQFHLSPAIRVTVSEDNSEIVLHPQDSGTPLAPLSQPGRRLRFRVFSMGRKSIRRLMRDATGKRSDVKHVGISFGGEPEPADVSVPPARPAAHTREYYFYLCYDGCQKRKVG